MAFSAVDFSRHEIASGIWADAMRALWLRETCTLVIADLHLGYAWAHRHAGNLLPIAPDDTLARIQTLLSRYDVKDLVLLGDIMHRALPLKPIGDTLRDALRPLAEQVSIRVIAGNHDRHLASALERCGISLLPQHWLSAGPHLLTHGDSALPEDLNPELGGRIIIGHEHPSISAGRGLKCPAFLVSEGLLVLPAFSRWAAGSVFRPDGIHSPLALGAVFETAIAILNDKLLPVPLHHQARAR